MINFSSPVPNAPASLETLSNFLVLLTDPEKSKARVGELIAATAESDRATADHKAATAALVVAQADHKALLAQREVDAGERLAAAQAAFNAECAHRKEQLDDREARLIELQAQAASDAKEAAAAKADYERRLKIIKSATG